VTRKKNEDMLDDYELVRELEGWVEVSVQLDHVCCANRDSAQNAVSPIIGFVCT
jgi:hypothetical protein